MELHCDTQSVIHLAENQAFHVRTKHIDMICHKLMEIINVGLVSLTKIHTKDNTANMSTKPMTYMSTKPMTLEKHYLSFIGVSHCQMMRSATHEGLWLCQ